MFCSLLRKLYFSLNVSITKYINYIDKTMINNVNITKCTTRIKGMHVNLLVLVRELGGIDVVIITAAIIATAGVTTIGDADRVILGLGVGVIRADLFLGQFSLFGLTYSSKETSSSGWSDMSRGGVTVIIV
jgi:hypothetical protein